MARWTEYLCVCLIIVYIVDLSGFTQSWKNAIERKLGGKCRIGRPFDCSQCITWWTLLLISHIDGSISPLMCCYIALLAFTADVLGQGMRIVKEGIKRLLGLLFDLTQR